MTLPATPRTQNKTVAGAVKIVNYGQSLVDEGILVPCESTEVRHGCVDAPACTVMIWLRSVPMVVGSETVSGVSGVFLVFSDFVSDFRFASATAVILDLFSRPRYLEFCHM